MVPFPTRMHEESPLRALAFAFRRVAPAVLLLAAWAGLGSATFPLTPDSTCYLEAARHLTSEGRLVLHRTVFPDLPGLFVPDHATGLVHLTWWPPLNPTVLSLLGRLTGDRVRAALGLNAALLVLSWLLAAHLLALVVRPGLAAWLAAAALSAPNVIDAHAHVWSEPLALALTLAALAAALRAGWRWALLGGALAGLSVGVRYTGISLCAAVVLAPALAAWRSGGRAVVRSGGAALAGVALGAGWLLARNVLFFGTPLPYGLPRGGEALYPLVRQAAQEVFLVLLPVRWPALARLEVLAPVAALVLLAWWWGRRRRPATGDAVLLAVVGYGALLVAQVLAANARFDIQDGLDERHALLLVVPAVLALTVLLARALPRVHVLALGGLAVALLAGHAWDLAGLREARAPRARALARMEAEAPLEVLRDRIPEDAGVISNNQVLAHFHLERRVAEPVHKFHDFRPPADYGGALRREGYRYVLWFEDEVRHKRPPAAARDLYEALARGEGVGPARVVERTAYWTLWRLE